MENTQTPQTTAPNPLEQPIVLSWQAPVIAKQDRSHRWYVIGGGIVVAGAAYGIITGSWPFTVVVVLCGAMYYLMRDHVPPLKTINIRESGVQLEERFLRWEDMKGFWFIQTPSYIELHFSSNVARQPDLMIQTGNQDIMQLRLLIGAHIPELTEKRESLLDAFIRITKL